MSLAEVIYEHSCRLPEQAAREALSYIELNTKKKHTQLKEE